MTPERVFVGLGANLGDPVATVNAALQALDALPDTRLVARSSLYRTAPLEAEGPPFVNAVAELRTALDPEDLLRSLQALEAHHHRQRPYRNAPRTLDLDLLLFGERMVDTPTLTVPHPRLHRRGFVLAPLLEIDPTLGHPALGPLAAWRPGTADQPIERLD